MKDKGRTEMKAKIWQIIVCILIALALLTGVSFGAGYAMRNIRAVIKLGDITVDSSTITYVASFYKMKYIEKHDHEGAGDTEEFWETLTVDGITHAEDYECEFKEFLRLTVAKAYVYITNHGYTAEDKIRVAEKSESVLRQYANGSVSEFNKIAKEYGFDFDDFQNADALFYKSEKADELLPDTLGMEQYEAKVAEAFDNVVFNRLYDSIDVIEVPIIND